MHRILALIAPLLWVASSAAPAAPFTLSADGTEVTDQATGLIWRRCREGRSGHDCTGGSPDTKFTHEAALAHVRSQPGWRLPTVKELASIVDRSRREPALDPALPLPFREFYFWTSSPYVGVAGHAWFVEFGEGTINGSPRSLTFYVRLVR